MAENSKIEWTDHTFNPWIGCTKVSPGCDHCYASVSTPARAMHVAWGPDAPRHRTAPGTWGLPKRWNDRHAEFFAAHGRRQRVFCASLADVFDNQVDPQWRSDLYDLIRATPNLDWLLLTKRIGNVNGWGLPVTQDGQPLPNLWIGATVVNQEEADRDIPKLLAVPARVRFLSMEPLLGPVDLTRMRAFGLHGFGRHEPGVDWVIVGGESGPGARPMHPEWARSLRDQCAAAGVPFLFKQHGEWAPHPPTPGFDEGAALRRGAVRYLQGDGREPDGHFRRGDAAVIRVGKKAAGRLLDGVTHDGFPS